MVLKIVAEVDVYVELGHFENIELFERGYYAVRARLLTEGGAEVHSLIT